MEKKYPGKSQENLAKLLNKIVRRSIWNNNDNKNSKGIN